MNWVIVPKEELHNNNSVILRDGRFIHIKTILKKEVGETIQVVVPNLGNFTFLISELKDTEVKIQLKENISFLFSRLKSNCFFSLPRPQTTKKILHLAGAYGINSLSFFATETKNKEYWTSPIYTNEWEKEIYTGMSQTGNFHNPSIKFGQKENWRTYLESWEGDVFILDRSGNLDVKELIQTNISNDTSLFVFGPESGWKVMDMEFFQKQKFKIVSLGNINLRTEFAFSSLLYILFKN
ncbi:RsmE family RNA methyltransferase [Leptospira sp. WS39.C2]